MCRLRDVDGRTTLQGTKQSSHPRRVGHEGSRASIESEAGLAPNPIRPRHATADSEFKLTHYGLALLLDDGVRNRVPREFHELVERRFQ